MKSKTQRDLEVGVVLVAVFLAICVSAIWGVTAGALFACGCLFGVLAMIMVEGQE